MSWRVVCRKRTHALNREENSVHNDSSEAIVDPHFDVRLGLHQEYKRILERFKDYFVTMKSSKARLIEKVVFGGGTLFEERAQN